RSVSRRLFLFRKLHDWSLPHRLTSSAAVLEQLGVDRSVFQETCDWLESQVLLAPHRHFPDRPSKLPSQSSAPQLPPGLPPGLAGAYAAIMANSAASAASAAAVSSPSSSSSGPLADICEFGGPPTQGGDCPRLLLLASATADPDLLLKRLRV